MLQVRPRCPRWLAWGWRWRCPGAGRTASWWGSWGRTASSSTPARATCRRCPTCTRPSSTSGPDTAAARAWPAASTASPASRWSEVSTAFMEHRQGGKRREMLPCPELKLSLCISIRVKHSGVKLDREQCSSAPLCDTSPHHLMQFISNFPQTCQFFQLFLCKQILHQMINDKSMF